MIFILLDKADKSTDEALGRFIIGVHAGVRNETESSMEQKKYIEYARENVFPVLNEEAKDYLANEYLSLRKSMARNSPIPITIRQLEAIVRISESLAKMELSEIANKEHAKEAVRLFKASTIRAAGMSKDKSDKLSIFGGNKESRIRLNRLVEEFIKNKIGVGESYKKSELVSEAVKSCNTDYSSVENILKGMIGRNDYEIVGKDKIIR